MIHSLWEMICAVSSFLNIDKDLLQISTKIAQVLFLNFIVFKGKKKQENLYKLHIPST